MIRLPSRRAAGEVGLIGHRAVKLESGRPPPIEIRVTADRRAGFGHPVVGSQIRLLLVDAAPQSLDEHLPPSAFAIHADRDAVAGQRAGG